MTNNQKLKHLKNLVRISQEHINKILAVEKKIRQDIAGFTEHIEEIETTKNNPINN